MIFRIVAAVFAEVVEVDWERLALYGLALEAQSLLRVSLNCGIVQVVVGEDLIFYVFGLEFEEGFNRKHPIRFQQLHKPQHNRFHDILQFRLIVYKLHVFLRFPTDVDILHELVVVAVDFQVIVKHFHGRKLEEDPGLLDLENDSLEENGASAEEEWVFGVLGFILHDHQVFINDFILQKNAKVRQKVELSLRMLLNNHLFLLKLKVGVRRSLPIRHQLVAIIRKLVHVVPVLILTFQSVLLSTVTLPLPEGYLHLLDFFLLFLVPDHEDLALAVLLQHLKHQVRELDRIVKKLDVV